MAAHGDVGEPPPPLPTCINSKLSLDEAIQCANLAGKSPEAQGLGDIIRVSAQDAKVFNEFLNENKSHPLVVNRRIYKNDDHSPDFIMNDIKDLLELRNLLHKYCSQKDLITHQDSLGPSITMIGTALQDIRNTKRNILWNKPIIPDHFLVKFMIKDDSLKQELQTTNSNSSILRIIKTRMSTYLKAISTKFPQIEFAKNNYLLQEHSIFAKDNNSDIIISLCITSRTLIADMKTEYLKNAPSRPLAGVWSQGITGRVPQIQLSDSITLTNASFPSNSHSLNTPGSNNHSNDTHDTIIIPTKAITSTADHNRINKILASYFRREKTNNALYTLESYRLAYENFINENPTPSPIPALPPQPAYLERSELPTAFIKLHALKTLSSAAFQLTLTYIQRDALIAALAGTPDTFKTAAFVATPSTQFCQRCASREHTAESCNVPAFAPQRRMQQRQARNEQQTLSRCRFGEQCKMVKIGNCRFIHPNEQGYSSAVEPICKFGVS